MIRHLIFDLDGTLVDSCAICIDILSGLLADRGSDHVIDPVAARPWMSQGGATMVAALLGHACGDPETELAEFRARYLTVKTPVWALFPGVKASLAQLRQAGFTLSICSNKPQNLCEKVLLDTGLAPMFNVVVGSQAGLSPKPAPDLMRAALKRLGASASDCLFIGDSELDHQVAKIERMPFVFMTYGYAEAGWLPDDSDCFDCFSTMARAVLDGIAPANAA